MSSEVDKKTVYKYHTYVMNDSQKIMWFELLGTDMTKYIATQIGCRWYLDIDRVTAEWCSKWPPLTATQALRHLVKFITALLMCSCDSHSGTQALGEVHHRLVDVFLWQPLRHSSTQWSSPPPCWCVLVAATQALKHSVKFTTTLLMCSCGSHSGTQTLGEIHHHLVDVFLWQPLRHRLIKSWRVLLLWHH